jgi:hypothetical protein
MEIAVCGSTNNNDSKQMPSPSLLRLTLSSIQGHNHIAHQLHRQADLQAYRAWRTHHMQRSAMRCGAVRCGVVWCGVVWCGVVWCGVVSTTPTAQRRACTFQFLFHFLFHSIFLFLFSNLRMKWNSYAYARISYLEVQLILHLKGQHIRGALLASVLRIQAGDARVIARHQRQQQRAYKVGRWVSGWVAAYNA